MGANNAIAFDPVILLANSDLLTRQIFPVRNDECVERLEIGDGLDHGGTVVPAFRHGTVMPYVNLVTDG